jgi:glycosyltransferase involved in cell wall biosynthesis
MRIGIDATICITNKPTGIGIYTINIINALAKLHDDLVVWTVDDTGMALEKDKIRPVLQGLRFIGKNLYQIRPFWLERFLPRLLKREGVDVLFSTVPSALSRSRVPHVSTVLDIIPLIFPGEMPAPVVWNYKYRLPAILKNATALVTISEHTKNDVERHYNINPQCMHTVPLGYDKANFKPKDGAVTLPRYGLETNGYLLYVGNASPRKNLNTLIKAYSQVTSTIPHKLVLCGAKTGTETKQLRELISQYNLGGKVVLLDYVRYTDLPALYSGAALFVYVSLYEGFGLPILEAMACGTPVLASNTTSIPEVAGEASVLIDPTNCDSIANAIVRIISDGKQLQRMSDAGLKRCTEFSWNKSAQQILSLLKSLVHQ